MTKGQGNNYLLSEVVRELICILPLMYPLLVGNLVHRAALAHYRENTKKTRFLGLAHWIMYAHVEQQGGRRLVSFLQLYNELDQERLV